MKFFKAKTWGWSSENNCIPLELPYYNAISWRIYNKHAESFVGSFEWGTSHGYNILKLQNDSILLKFEHEFNLGPSEDDCTHMIKICLEDEELLHLLKVLKEKSDFCIMLSFENEVSFDDIVREHQHQWLLA